MNTKFKNSLIYLSVIFNLLFLCVIIIFIYRINKFYKIPYRYYSIHAAGLYLKCIKNTKGDILRNDFYDKNKILSSIDSFYNGHPAFTLSLYPNGKVQNKSVYYLDKKIKFVLIDQNNDGNFEKKIEKLPNGNFNVYLNKNEKWEKASLEKDKNYNILFQKD